MGRTRIAMPRIRKQNHIERWVGLWGKEIQVLIIFWRRSQTKVRDCRNNKRWLIMFQFCTTPQWNTVRTVITPFLSFQIIHAKNRVIQTKSTRGSAFFAVNVVCPLVTFAKCGTTWIKQLDEWKHLFNGQMSRRSCIHLIWIFLCFSLLTIFAIL